MTQDVSDQPRGNSAAQVSPELRAEADRLRRLSDPKLTAPIYGDPSDNGSYRRRPTFFGRLREALFP